jgi:hypothetical protein
MRTLWFLVGFFVGGSCIAKAAEPPAEQKKIVEDESGCSNVLQVFNGYQLTDLHVDPETGKLSALYLKRYSAHDWGLVLLQRAECAGPYRNMGEKRFDPKPRKCETGECV